MFFFAFVVRLTLIYKLSYLFFKSPTENNNRSPRHPLNVLIHVETKTKHKSISLIDQIYIRDINIIWRQGETFSKSKYSHCHVDGP